MTILFHQVSICVTHVVGAAAAADSPSHAHQLLHCRNYSPMCFGWMVSCGGRGVLVSFIVQCIIKTLFAVFYHYKILSASTLQVITQGVTLFSLYFILMIFLMPLAISTRYRKQAQTNIERKD